MRPRGSASHADYPSVLLERLPPARLSEATSGSGGCGRVNPRERVIESQATNGPAAPKRSGPGIKEVSPDAPETLLSPEALAYAARVRAAERELVKNKAYRATPIGGEVGRFLRSMRWSDKADNSIDTYEIVLSRLSYDFAHHETLATITTEMVRDFLDEHWGEAAPATRRNRLAIVKSFFAWAVEERGLGESPAAKIKPPKRASVERQAYTPETIDQLTAAQPLLRDQIALQLMGRLALRKNELRLLKVKDVDLGRGTIRIHGKGGKVTVQPIGFPDLKTDLEVHLVGRGPDEYLLYPKTDSSRPMDPGSMHRWFKRALERAGLPTTVKMHELRHSAADNLWRVTGDLMLAQQLLRHESVATTQAYLHPTRDDLAAGLASLNQVVRSETEETA
jgi:site-specific recombinase XerD